MFNKILLTAPLLFIFFISNAQYGPAGIGTKDGTSTLILWLDADSLGLPNNSDVALWNDLSGNNNNFEQVDNNLNPVLKLDFLNNHDVLEFSKTGNRIVETAMSNMATNQITTVIVYRTTDSNDGLFSYAVSGSDNEYLLFNNASQNIYINSSVVNTAVDLNNDAFQIVANRWRSSDGSLISILNGTQVYSGTLSSGTNISAGGSLSLGGEQDGVNSGYDDAQAFSGRIAEVIVFRQYLNNAEIIGLNNYLNSKYGLTLAANDVYGFDSNHGAEVAGVGRVDASNILSSAYSAMFGLSNASDLDDAEYAFAGHNNGSFTWTTTEIPAMGLSNIRRLAREWRIDETGDIGTLTLSVDTTYLDARPSEYSKFVLLVDSDGDFTNASVYELESIGDDEIFQIDIDIIDGQYYTIGCVRPVLGFTSASDFELETIDPNLSVLLNYIPLNTVNFDLNTQDIIGEATSGIDYTSISSSGLSISSPDFSYDFSLDVAQDTELENSEELQIIVSNIPSEINALNSTFTYSIDDDDNPRKIYFEESSTTVDEFVGSFSIQVSLTPSLVDNTNPTTVDYTVTSGSATGSGTDFILANGTATIPASSVATTFSVTIIDDAIDEVSETIVISLTNPTNSSLSTVEPVIHTVNITDNDQQPEIQFSTSSSSSDESAGTIDIEVSLSTVSGQDITVDYTLSGTAEAGGVDYTFTNGTLTIIAGDISENLSIILNDDSEIEFNETIILTLSNPTLVALGSTDEHTITITDNDGEFGFNGPGGVGSTDGSSALEIWLNGDNIAVADGANVSSWQDISGNGNNFTSSISPSDPIFDEALLNGFDVVNFNGDRLKLNPFNGMPTSQISVFSVYRTANASVNNDALLSYNASGEDNEYLIFNSASSTLYTNNNTVNSGDDIATGSWNIYANKWRSSNGAAYIYNNGVEIGSGTMSSGIALTSGGSLTIGDEQDAVDGGYAGQSLNGDIAEIIVFNSYLNDARRKIIENYLSTKYALTLSAGDLFSSTYETNGYDNSLAGIGSESNSDNHLDASDGTLRLNNSSDLEPSEYILFAHNNGATTWSNLEIPSGADTVFRIAKEWILDATVTDGVTIDLILTDPSATLGALSSDLTGYGIMTDDDGDFSNGGTSIYSMSQDGADYVYSGLNIASDVYVTFIAFGITAEFTLIEANISESGTSYAVEITMSNASVSDTDFNFDVDLLSSATGGGTDYSIDVSPVTITSGNTTGLINITLNNDGSIETDETVIINLSSATNGVTLSGNTQFILTIQDEDALSGIGDGPANIRDAIDYGFWLASDVEVYEDDGGTDPAEDTDAILFWGDLSGNGNFGDNDATYSNAIYSNNGSDNVNQKSVVNLSSGTAALAIADDALINLSNVTQKTIIVTFKTGNSVSGTQIVYEQGGANDGFNIHVLNGTVRVAAWNNGSWTDQTNGYIEFSTPVTTNNTYIAMIEYDGTNVNGYVNSISLGSTVIGTGAAIIDAHNGDIGIGVKNQNTRFLSGASGGADDSFFVGKPLELLSIDGVLNDAERIILHNYLAGKWNASLSGGDDYFNYKTTHSYNVSGIGQSSTSVNSLAANSSSVLSISNPSSLSDGEYLIFGHDNGSIASYTTSEVPNTAFERLAREWRLTETGELGTIKFTFDPSADGGNPSASYNQYALLVDSDGDFSSGAQVYVMTQNGSVYQTDVNVTNGNFITIGAFAPTVQFSVASAYGNENVSPASITISLNYPISTNVTVDYAVDLINSTATITNDFTLTDGTATILAGSNSTSFDIVIVNDSDIESAEDIIIDLSNPNSGTSLGTLATTTYQIIDNDQLVNVDFASTSSSVSESNGSLFVTLKINQTSLSDVEVDYTLSGSATQGTDYTLANGTATITAGNTSTTVQLILNNDVLYELSETAILTLSNPVNANLGTNDTHTVTITDNDTQPEIEFAISTDEVSENVNTKNITIQLSEIAGVDVAVDYAIVLANTTATAVSDYTFSDGTLTITAGSSSETISVGIVDDISKELGEIIQIELYDNGNLTNATIGSQTTFDLVILDNDESGFTGPGGIKDPSDFAFWLRADYGVESDSILNTAATNGDPFEIWLDYSGNDNNAKILSASSSPNYLSSSVNLKPAIDFSSTADTLIITSNTLINTGGPYSQKTLIVSFQSEEDINTQQVVYEQGAGSNGIAIYIINGEARVAHWNESNGIVFGSVGLAIEASKNYVAILSFDSGAGTLDGYLNGDHMGQISGRNASLGGHGDVALGISNGWDQGNPTEFNGKIMEAITLNGVLTTSERIIIENYQSAKYGIDISGSGNDFYAFQGSHSYGVAGIGRISSTNFHTKSASDSIIIFSNATNLDDNEFIIFGHDNGDITDYVTTDAPSGVERIAREWRIDVTGTIGTLSIQLDTTQISGIPSSGFDKYFVMVDSDGSFSSGSTFIPLTLSGAYYTADNVTLSDNQYLTVAVVRPTISFDVSTSNGLESVTTVDVTVNLNVALDENISVNIAQTGGTATENTDYSFSDQTLVIPAGSTSVNASISVVNDFIVESDETIILTLSSPSDGILGANITHSYAINDDDNFRKANFYRSDSTDVESATSKSIAVFLTASDPVNITEIYYEISNETASNDGIDYTVTTPGTLTFAVDDSVEYITITIEDDAIDEFDETFTVSLTGGENATLGDTTSFEYTITDDDLAPSVKFSYEDKSGSESFQTVDLAIELSAPSGKDITIPFVFADISTDGDGVDFISSSENLVISAGNTTDSLQFTVIDDGVEESNESLSITMQAPTNASLAGDSTTVTYAILDNDGLGFNGPGGVGNLTSQIKLWLDGTNSPGNSDGDLVSTWSDLTENNNDATQSTPDFQPTYLENTWNSRSTLQFDGTNDLLIVANTDDINTAGPYDQKTILVAFRTSSDVTTRQMIYEEGGGDRGLSIYIFNGELYIGGWNDQDDDAGATTPWPSTTPPYTLYVTNPVIANTNNFLFLQFDFETGGSGFNGEVSASVNGNNLSEIVGAGRLFTHPNGIGIGAVNQSTVFHDLNASSVDFNYEGFIGEVLVGNFVYNSAQRKLVNNYLAAKFDIAIPNDLFAYEATHGYDVIGLGQDSAAASHNEAEGTNNFKINNPSDLDDNEYLLIGHDNANLDTWVSSEVPNNDADNFRRVAREWRADMTGNLGSVSIILDNSELTSPPVGFEEKYVILVDDDGDFTSGAVIYGMEDQGGGIYNVDLVDLTGDKFLTFALYNPTIGFELASSNELENNSPVYINIISNATVPEDITVDYTVTDVSTSSDDDYILISGTATIVAGNDSTYLTLNLVNDVLVENSESLTITLSNPSTGVILDDITVHTFTLNDDDNPRKLNFANADSTNTEATSPILINVFMSEDDIVNETKVAYTISGTASDGGTDYSLLPTDTLTFVAADTLETITITLNDDVIDENDETIIITLTYSENAALGDTIIYTHTIQDNDTEPTVEFSTTSSGQVESITNASITVQLSSVSAKDVTVDFSTNGSSTATAGGIDYTLTGTQVTIPAGSTTETIDFTLFNDVAEEIPDEVIILDISNPTNATLGTNIQHTFTVIDDDSELGPNGPGGVGNLDASTDEMVFWFRADVEVYSDGTATTLSNDGDSVEYWGDYFGTIRDAFNEATYSYPSLNATAVNNLPGVVFDNALSQVLTMNNNGVINTASSYAAKSFVVVFETGADVSTRQVLFEAGGNANGFNIYIRNGNLYFGVTIGSTITTISTAISTNTAYVAIVEYDDADDELRLSLNGTEVTDVTITGTLSSTSSAIGIGGRAGQARFDNGTSSGLHGFTGTILEIAHLNNVTFNEGQKRILYSHYAGKYNLTFANDFYAHDATHPYDILGISQASDGSRHYAASYEMLEIDQPSSPDNGDYILIGHDNGSLAAWSETVSASLVGYIDRLNRTWIVDKTNEIGTVRFAIDSTAFPSPDADKSEYILILDNDNDGDFSDDVDGVFEYIMLDDRFGKYVRAEDVNFPDGTIFTIGVGRNVAINDGDFNDPNTWLIGVPGPEDDIVVVSNLVLDADTEVNNMEIAASGSIDLNGFQLTVNGTFDVNGTFTANAGTVEYAASSGIVCVEGLTYYNLIISGSGTKILCGNVTIQNDITINNNPTLSTDGGNNYSIEIQGDWANAVAATFTPNSSTVTFNGTANQTITKTSSTESFYNLVIDKTSGDVVLNNHISVSSTLTLSQGNIRLGTRNLLITNNTDGAISGGSSVSYIEAGSTGVLSRRVANATTFDYPVGDTDDYSPLTLTLNSGTLSTPTITVRLTDAQHPNLTGSGNYITRYWTVNQSGITNPNFDISYTYTDADFVGSDEDGLIAVKYNTDAVSTNTIVNAAGNTISWAGVTSFSDFTAGDIIALPIELAAFDATISDDLVTLTWTTASETNNDYFIILHSTDGINYIELASVDGQGTTSNATDYHFAHTVNQYGVHYYRLKQVDFDEQSTVSKVVAVVYNPENISFTVIGVPNPTTSQSLVWEISSLVTESPIHLQLFDLSGKTLWEHTAQPEGHLTRITTQELSGKLSQGIHVLQVEQAGVYTWFRVQIKE